MDIKNLAIRTGSGIIYVAVILATILLQDKIVLGLFVMLLALWATCEYSEMIRHAQGPEQKPEWFAVILDVITTMCIADPYALPVVPILFIARFVYAIFAKQGHQLRSLAYSVLGYIYIGIPLLILYYLEAVDYKIVLLLFCALWINDTGAYLVGSIMGRHKLCERISPKKTIEGFVGGVALNVIVALIVSLCIPNLLGNEVLSRPLWVVMAVVIVSVFGTLGDLFESLLKRTVGVKDSGHLIPGHGGILDRIDSLLFAGPVLLLLLLLI